MTSACHLGSVGYWNWPNTWILLGLNFVACVISMIVLWRDDRLRAERSNNKAGKSWDKPIVFIVVLLGPITTWIPFLEKYFVQCGKAQIMAFQPWPGDGTRVCSGSRR